MKLITKEIALALERGAEVDTDEGPIPVVVKFFDPCGSWTWFATAGQRGGPGEHDWSCFGLGQGFEAELGSFSLAELAKVRGPLGLGIERDLHFSGAIDVSSWPPQIVSERRSS